MNTFKRYFKVWWLMSRNAFLAVIMQRYAALVLLIGKIIRFAFFVVFIIFLLKGTKTLAGYSLNQTLFFFLTFNLIDITSQFLFREVYRFRALIIKGNFDLLLTRPISALFRSLMGGADLLDLLTIPPLLFFISFIAKSLFPSPVQVFCYLILLLNGLVISAAFHIAVISFGIITLEVDNTIFIYRDFSGLGRFPIDIYKEPLKGILTYLIPIGIMITLPAKALMGLVSLPGVLWSLGLGVIAIVLSIKFWNFALTKYTSASS